MLNSFYTDREAVFGALEQRLTVNSIVLGSISEEWK